MLRLNIDPSSSEEESPSPEQPPSKRPRLTPPKPLSHFRIFSWNCDDIAPYTEHTTPSTSIDSYFNHVSPPPRTNASHLPKPPPCTQWKIRSILRERDWPEFFCLQEVKIQASERSRLKTAKDAANDSKDGGPEYTMYSNLAVRAKRPAQNRRMYGVITYVRSDVAEHVRVARGVDWDDEGRVLILEMAVINLYAVNGTDAPYIPRSTRNPTGQSRHERKREFNRLLKDECLRLRERGMEICIVGDVNISRTVRDSVPRLRMAEPHVLPRREFNDHFLPETGLIDAWRGKHGDDVRGYTWFLRGVKEGTDCARVDMILVTPGLYACATGVEIEKWGGMASKSDHAIMWIEIDGLPQKNT